MVGYGQLIENPRTMGEVLLEYNARLREEIVYMYLCMQIKEALMGTAKSSIRLLSITLQPDVDNWTSILMREENQSNLRKTFDSGRDRLKPSPTTV